MDLENPVIKLCAAGTQAEFNGRFAEAHALYQQAWELASNDYEACIAAHYVARHQTNPTETLRWNQEALNRANAVTDEAIMAFYPSLYLNMGDAYEKLGQHRQAKLYYDLAAQLGFVHQPEKT